MNVTAASDATPALLLERITCVFASRERAGESYVAVKDTTLAARALRRHAQARRAGADADPRPEDHAHGRAVFGPRHPDPAAHGKRIAGALVGEPEIGPLHHPRSGRSHRAVRSRDRSFGGS